MAAQSGASRPAGAADELEALDELPPERVQILVGVAVERPLEVAHHELPAGGDEQAGRPCRGRARRAAARASGLGHSGVGDQPVGVSRQPPEQHRRRLGRQRVRRPTEEVRQRRVEPLVVDRVPELVQHRVHPVLGRPHVREHADVVAAVHVDAEGVLALAVALVEVGAGEQALDVEADSVEVAPRQRLEILLGEPGIEVDLGGGCLLEERIAVVPRAELVDADPEPRRESLVERGLVSLEQRRRALLDAVEQREELVLVELRALEHHRVVGREAERVGRIVAQADELEHVVRDLGPDLLRRLPGAPPELRVVGALEDLADAVLRCRLAIELCAKDVEAGVERLLELDHPLDRLGRQLVRPVRIQQHRHLAGQVGILPDAVLGGGAELLVRVAAREDGADLRVEPRALLLPSLLAGRLLVPGRLVCGEEDRLQLGLECVDALPDAHASAPASTSTTRSWSSGSIAVWNGSASVRCATASATGQSPSAKP